MSQIQKLKGIFLHKIHYSDHSVIAKIYTDQLGMQSFIIRGVGNSKKNKKTGLLQPLTLLDIVSYYNPKKNIQQPKELTLDYHFKNIQQQDFVRSSIAVFINEMIYKSIREEEQNLPMFDFLYNAIKFLDLTEASCLNFHLVFAMQFSRFLGFPPSPDQIEKASLFDLREGRFSNAVPLHDDFIPSQLIEKFKALISMDFTEAAYFNLSNQERKSLLHYLLTYYALHLHGFGEMKSHHVLESVLA